MSVTVVIPCHAQEHYLFRALSSVVWQLKEGDAVVVIHDSAEALDVSAIAPFKDRVIVLENGERKGVAFSRNRGVKHAQSEWIKFLDADDVLAPFALNIVRGTVEIAEATRVITGGAHRITDDAYIDYVCATEETFANFHRRNPTLPSLTFVRRAALIELGLFNEEIDHEEDWDLWFRMRERYGMEAFQIVDQPVCYYWISKSDRQNKYRRASVNGQFVRDYFRERYGADPIR